MKFLYHYGPPEGITAVSKFQESFIEDSTENLTCVIFQISYLLGNIDNTR